MRASAFMTPVGLAALLDAAEHFVGVDPNQADKLASLCGQLAAEAQAPALAPRAHYLQAQVQAAKGELDAARRLIEAARAGYAQLGMTSEMLRTNAGLMAVLGESGNYQAALSIGQQTLAQMGVAGEATLATESAEYGLIAAMVYHNCGECYEQTGRYEEALTAFAAAGQRYQKQGMNEHVGRILVNTGLVRISFGQLSAALGAFNEALTIYRAAGLVLYQAEAFINIGEAHLLLGNFVPSLRAFEQAAGLYDDLGELVDQHILLRHMADAYLALNLYGEALDAYQKAAVGLATAGLAYHHAFTLWGMGMALAAQGRLTEAEQRLAAAVAQFRSLENLPLLSAVMLEQAALFERLGQPVAARTLAKAVLDLVDDSKWPVQKIYAYLRNADLAQPVAAEPLLLAATQLVKRVEIPQLRYRLEQRLGHLYRLFGNVDAAQRYLENAINEIERLRSPLVQERMRASFLADKMAAYEDLVQLHLQRGDHASIAAAFQVAERAKSRALVDLLSGVIQAKQDVTVAPEITEPLQTLQADLNAIYNEILAGNPQSRTRPQDVIALKARAVELEQTISRLRLRNADLQSQVEPGKPPPVQPTVWETLEDNLALVVYHIIGDEIMAFVCTAGQLHLVRRLSTVSAIEGLLQRLTSHWERFQLDPALIERHHRQFHQSAQRVLHLLHGALMAPVRQQLDTRIPKPAAGLRKLAIVPHGLLHQVPFHALYDGQHYLLEEWVISYAPSATVFALCQQRRINDTGAAIVVGVPDAQLPAVEREVHLVAAALRHQGRAVRLLLNDAATVAALTPLTDQAGIVHIASHGLFRGDNPLFSALKLHDRWLTATDVAQFRLSDALVILSACESGRSLVMGGDEILGLTYAFLSAGAATLVVSQWLVQDKVTAALMVRWYQHLLHSPDLAAALRAAQLEIMAEYPHPYYWAPFLLVGQRAKHNTAAA